MRFISIVFLVSIVLFWSCNKKEIPVTVSIPADSTINAWLDSMDISAISHPSGIYYYADSLNPLGQRVNGSGQVLAIFYTMTDLLGDTLFQHTRLQGDSLLFKFGSNAVYPIGIDQVINVMRVGEVYNFILPPDQAYDQLPVFSTRDATGIVILKIELVSIMEEQAVFDNELARIDEFILVNDLNDTVNITEVIDTTFTGPNMDIILSVDTSFIYDIDSVNYFSTGLRYKRVNEGIGLPAVIGDTVVFSYDADQLSGVDIVSNTDFIYILGLDLPGPLFPALEQGIQLVSTNETGLIMTPSSLAYRESVLVIPHEFVNQAIAQQIIPGYAAQVRPYQPLVIEVSRTE